jgi:very-short-patch-repair endonuclease
MRRRPFVPHNQLVLLQRAQQMRSHLTPSEERLWQSIRSQQLGVTFRRQAVIGRYIVDFCALSLKLIVEVDGSVHALKRASARRRNETLERAGYRVLRLDARFVMRDLPRAVSVLRAAIAECTAPR